MTDFRGGGLFAPTHPIGLKMLNILKNFRFNNKAQITKCCIFLAIFGLDQFKIYSLQYNTEYLPCVRPPQAIFPNYNQLQSI